MQNIAYTCVCFFIEKIILFISGVEPAEEDLQDQFNATFLQSTITIYTVNVGRYIEFYILFFNKI